VKAYQTQTDIVSEIKLIYTYTPYPDTSCPVIVTIRLFNKLPTIEFEVFLGELPLTDFGSEATINFISYDIDNQETFYTDSNGLEMQKRILNFRENW
jgi:hypothetical protein